MALIDRIVYAVRETSEELAYRAKCQYRLGTSVGPYIMQLDNDKGKGLCAKYNHAIQQTLEDLKDLSDDELSDRWIIFSHDDVDLMTSAEVLYHQLDSLRGQGADIIVVAGNTQVPQMVPGSWWFGLVSGTFKGSGAVVHITPDAKGLQHVESYGPYPQEIAAFDGLWFAVNLKTLRTKPELRFDAETFDGYHYYDADFAATARSLGCKMWAAGIMVFHNKWGRGVEDPAFGEYQLKFAHKWQSRIADYYRYNPAKVDVDFVKNTVAYPTQS